MKIEITIQHLLMLITVLFVLSFLLQKKEKFESEAENAKPKNKACSQQSVNYGFQHYIFSGPKLPARA
jgi:hypothetical protein